MPVLGFEYECYVLHANDDVLRRGDYASLRALSRVDNAYSIGRRTESADLLGEFINRMDSIGIPVEAAHSELGPGFFEFAMSPMDAMRAADSAVRARQYFRDLCAERGLVATFMAKLRIEASGSGGHVHQSVTRDGVNQFSDGANGLSDTGRAYLGGLVRSMGDYTVLLNPLLNSYKRISAGFFVAERATWGWDNRNAACRVVHNAGAAATRVEHRRPGADANPYLVAAALLAGGLEGLRDSVDPGDPLEIGSDIATAGDALPSTLPAAIAAFRGSSRARSMLGDRFVDCYAATRDAEVAAFETSWNTSITDWELRRYVEHL